MNAFAATEDQVETIFWDNVYEGTLTFITAPTAGCTVAFAGFVTGTDSDVPILDPVTPVSDLDGNTWTTVKSATGGTALAFISIASNVTSAGTFSITLHPDASSPAIHAGVAAKSWCGMAAAALDKSATAADDGPQASDATVTTAATTQAIEIVVAVAGICSEVGDTAIGTATGYTDILTEANCGGHTAGSIGWKTVSAAGAQTASWSHTDITGSSGWDGWAAAIVTLKDAAAATPNKRRTIIIQ